MQTHGGQAAEDAITGHERSFHARLLVDWNRNGNFDHPLSDLSPYVSRVSTDRALKGSAPEEITLIQGKAAAELTATFGGSIDGNTLAAVFSPYNPRSSFYGDSLVGYEVDYAIEVDTVLGVVSYPQFKGRVRNITTDRSTGTVDMSALDRVEELRTPIDLPTWAMSRYWENRGFVRAQLCDAQWVVDYCLRQCKVSPTGQVPVPPEEITNEDANESRFFLSGTGSVAPGVGYFDNWNAQTFPDTEGGAGEMYVINGVQPPELNASGEQRPLCFDNHTQNYTNKYWMDNKTRGFPDYTYYFSFQIPTWSGSHHNVNGAPVVDLEFAGSWHLQVYVTEGTTWARLWAEDDSIDERTGNYTIPSGRDSVWVQFGYEYSPQNGLRMYFAFDEIVHPWEYLRSDDPPNSLPFNALEGLVTVNRVVEFNDLAVQRNFWFDARQMLDTVVQPAKYLAVLDPSNNRFTSLPDRQGEDAWDVIGEVADAEFASVFWDEEGIFRFWTYDHVVSLQSNIVRTVTLDDLTNLNLSTNLDSVRNVWSVTMNRVAGVYGQVFEATDVNAAYIAPNTRKIIRFWKTGITFPYPYELVRYGTLADEGGGFPQWDDAVTHGYVPQWLKNGVWQEDQYRINNEINFVFLDREGYLCVSMYNDWPEPMRFAHDPMQSGTDSKPALRIEGSYLEEQDDYTSQVRTQSSIDKYGKRNISLDSDWHQDEYQTSRLLDLITERTAEPVPNTQDISIPGDPRLQLGDTVSISDPTGFGPSIKAQIYGITRDIDETSGCQDTLTVEFIYEPSRWLLGTEKSVLGSSTILS